MDLSGRIGASSSARGTTPRYVALAGRATSSSSAVFQRVPWAVLSARASAKASVVVSGLFPVIAMLGGRISGQSAASLTGEYPAFLSGRILGAARSGLAKGDYTVSFTGRITGSSRAGGNIQPLFELIGGTIHAKAEARFGLSELLQPLPPYPIPFAVRTRDDYLDLITSEHNQKPRYMETVAVSIDGFVETEALAATLPGLFDLDYSVGEQEDFTGEWIGKSRWIEIPNVFFTWDVEGLGWNQANWKGPFDASDKLQRLDDYHYRLLLYAAVIANHWNGSVPNAYEAWDTLFQYTGLKVIIQDFGNMTMMYGMLWSQQPDTILLNLFTTGQMDLKPEGIELIEYIFQVQPDMPLFCWDAQSDAVGGWDKGGWGILVPPGQGYVPFAAEGDPA